MNTDKVHCKCGSVLLPKSVSGHLRSKKHLKWETGNPGSRKDTLSELGYPLDIVGLIDDYVVEMVKIDVIVGLIEYHGPEEVMFMSAMDGNLDSLIYVLSKGFEGVNLHTERDRVLRLASEYGHLSVVEYSVSEGADIHADDDCALRWASANGHLSVVKYLVLKGADIHVGGDMALMYASVRGHLSMVEYLVSKGADIHAIEG